MDITKISIGTKAPEEVNVNDVSDLRPIMKEQIEHFFTHYKDLEKNKWVKIGKWGNAPE